MSFQEEIPFTRRWMIRTHGRENGVHAVSLFQLGSPTEGWNLNDPLRAVHDEPFLLTQLFGNLASRETLLVSRPHGFASPRHDEFARTIDVVG